MRDKQPLNEKGNPHGYWEKYHKGGTLWYICDYIDGEWYGYFEHHRLGRINKEYNAR